jgi:CAAX protease family protein
MPDREGAAAPTRARERGGAVLGIGALAAFIAIAYVLAWAWSGPAVASGDLIEKGGGWPTHIPALFSPAIAALLVTAWVLGRPGLTDLVRRMARSRMPGRWWAATLSPVAFLGIALAIAVVADKLPSLSDFGRYGGLSLLGVVPVTLIVILAGLGEETGWRGFALPILQPRYGALGAALLVTPIWALWHAPFFLTVQTYNDLAPPAYLGFVFGLGCGSVVLTWLYYGTGQSILACAIWHGGYNLTTATAAAGGLIAPTTSTLVIVQALVLVWLELRARKRGHASVLGPRRDPSISSS